MASTPHLYPITVGPADIDFMGHANNAIYLTWVQEAVIDHWRSVAPPDAVAQHLWVALSHEIEYLRPAFLGDHLVAAVVLEKVQGARAFYDTIIRRGDEIVARARSCWCCVDAKTHRAVRLGREIVDLFFPKAALVG
jgi:acyl-CoA thioester hydrolase